MNHSHAQVVSADVNLGYLNQALEPYTVEALQLSWKRDSHDKQKYNLVDRNNRAISATWRSASSWGTYMGNSYPRLKDAKAAIIEQIKGQIFTRIEELNSRMEVIGDASCDDFDFEMENFECDALERLLSEHYATKLAELIAPLSAIKRRNRNNRFSNAVHAFDYGQLMASFLQVGFRHRHQPGKKIINPARINFSATMEIMAGDSMRRDSEFGEDGWLSVNTPTLDQADVDQSIIDTFNQVVAYLGISTQ